MKYEVLLADDDDSIRLVLSTALTRAGHQVKSTDNAQTLLKWAQAGAGDLIITDVMMGGEEVFKVLPDIMEARPDLPVIVISANNTVNTALKTGQYKVFEYIPKPFDLDVVTQAVSRAGHKSRARRRPVNAELRKLPMIGRSPAMQPVFRAVSRFASSDLPVFIQGAVGTGKDLVARLLHDGGPRQDRPFLRMSDFANISLSLQKVNGGDIYIDEIAELAPAQQEALLALMSECEQIPRNKRPRILSASRKDLRSLANSGKFRDDLFFRINVAEIHLPSLAQRDKDIYELADAFLEQASSTAPRRFDSQALDMLHRHDWQGNIRELENLVKRLAALYSDDVITAKMVLDELSGHSGGPAEQSAPLEQVKTALSAQCRQLLSQPIGEAKDSIVPYDKALSWVEKPLIVEALRLTGGNKAKAADLLGIHRNTLRTKMKAYVLT